MPKDSSIRSVLIIGSGPIVIGQACEFDYSGTQAARSLREEGVKVYLINSNPATIMTDPMMADRVYLLPLTVESIEQILEENDIDAVLPTMGGQTALNLAKEAEDLGIWQKYNCRLIGVDIKAIDKAEDREKFRQWMIQLGVPVAPARTANSFLEGKEFAQEIGFPLVIRPSFTLGGTGGGFVHSKDELDEALNRGLQASPIHEVLVERAVLGWKEFELELLRDANDNVVIICTVENFDPMGVHTGDSITVAPAMTLSDTAFQEMRNQAILMMRSLGNFSGGCNVQFAQNPANEELIVVEINPRVSRSSALASKATGYPIAKIAAKLAVGYTLDELTNDITGTSAAFEPTIDYVVVKWPRFAFEKFPGADVRLGTQMKSVGEAMAIGRTFPEAVQKAARSLETGKTGFISLFDRIDYRSLSFSPDASRDLAHDAPPLAKPKPTLPPPGGDELWAALEKAVRVPTAERLFYVGDALRHGISQERLNKITGIDPWFLAQLGRIVAQESKIRDAATLDEELLRESKRLGFSDVQLGTLRNQTQEQIRTL